MSNRMWKIDPALTRPEHKLHFDWAAEEEWGANVCFLCQNEGCCYSVIVPVNHPDIGKAAGLCFDATQGEIVEK